MSTINTLADFPPERFSITAYCNACGHSGGVDTTRLPLSLPMETLEAKLLCSECQSREVRIRIGWAMPTV